jgi:nucleoside-diphosphate-sugar epimerase
MRVFVAGATGVVGRRLLPLLTSQGHEVIGWPARTAPPSRSRCSEPWSPRSMRWTPAR